VTSVAVLRSGGSPRVGLVSLGCPKATVDTERLATRLRVRGYQTASDYASADLVVVNTCGFLKEAIDESLAAIGEAIARNGRVIVTGCLGARAELVRAAHPSVLAVTGPQDEAAVLAVLEAHLPAPQAPDPARVPRARLRLTPRHYAYLKIAEGCNHRCTFCVIPALRGRLRSRPPGDVLEEAEALVAAGVRELLLVAQDTPAYGTDLRPRTGFWRGRPVRARLPELVDALAALAAPAGVWLRLHYVYPYPTVDELVARMAEGKLVPYLDVPFQHASARILERMRRPADPKGALERIRRWRTMCPELAIRSTFIVGFPGETERDFAELLDFLEQAQLDRVGCFAYSPVEGAAANALPGAVPPELKEERRARLMARQAEISRARLTRRLGRTETVLVDAPGVGRSAREAPEVDGVIRLRGRAQPGEFARVLIESADEHDLHGRVIDA